MNKDSLAKMTSELPFPPRAMNMFRRMGITHIWQVCMLDRIDFYMANNVGRITLAEVEKILTGAGVSLGASFTVDTIFSMQRQTGVKELRKSARHHWS